MFPHKAIAPRVFHIALIALLSCASVDAVAQSGRRTAQASQKTSPGETSNNPGPDSEKLDVTDLERKYWAAKDTDFNVVKNRLYSKAGRFALTGMYGTLVNDPWSEGPTYGVSANYYFSERYGVEVTYSNSDTTDNQVTGNLIQQGGKANHGKYKQFYGAAFNWVPFYAKMSVLNSAITYFDMSFSVGAGVSEYEQQRDIGPVRKTSPTLTLDVSQHFFLNNHMALRVDLKNRWYEEELVYFSSGSIPAGGTREIGNETNHTTMLLFGLTLYY